MLDIYSHCYIHLKQTGCNQCVFNAEYDLTNQTVQINVSFCGPNSLSAYAYTNGECIWSKPIIEVNCEPADCPFSNAQTPICIPPSPF